MKQFNRNDSNSSLGNKGVFIRKYIPEDEPHEQTQKNGGRCLGLGGKNIYKALSDKKKIEINLL